MAHANIHATSLIRFMSLPFSYANHGSLRHSLCHNRASFNSDLVLRSHSLIATMPVMTQVINHNME
jgi:hypothetical protein